MGVASIAAAGAVAGCGGSPFTPDVRYRMIGLPAAVDGACAESPDPASPTFTGEVAVRLTYVDAGTRTLRCDTVVPIGGSGAVIAVPDATEPVDLYVEYVDAAGAVLGRGAATGIDLDAGGEIAVSIAPSAGFACAPDRAAAGRAFHSATLLPTGELLLLGGIAGPAGGDAIDPTAGFFLQPRAEIYDPATGVVRLVAIPDLLPRAFHEAYVIGADANGVSIAVLGGLTVTGDPASTPVGVVGTSYRIEAAPNAVAAAGQIVHYDATQSTFSVEAILPASDVTGRAFAAMSRPTDADLAVVGGQDLTAGGQPARSSADRVVPSTGLLGTTIATRRGRIGATVTAIAPGQLLVWGGDVTAGDMLLNPELGELLTDWNGTPGVAPIALAGTSEQGPHRAFHAAARAGDGAVIVAGGFRMDLDATAAPVGSVMQRLQDPGASLIATTILDGSLASPAGYLAAATVGDGDVLVAGGNPDAAAAGCIPDAGGLICAIPQALRYDSATTTAAITGPMGVARYGLALTVLADGTVIATGGLTVIDGALQAAPDLEIYEPRGTADDPLRPDITRAPGDVARNTGGDPAAPCTVVVGPDGGV